MRCSLRESGLVLFLSCDVSASSTGSPPKAVYYCLLGVSDRSQECLLQPFDYFVIPMSLAAEARRYWFQSLLLPLMSISIPQYLVCIRTRWVDVQKIMLPISDICILQPTGTRMHIPKQVRRHQNPSIDRWKSISPASFRSDVLIAMTSAVRPMAGDLHVNGTTDICKDTF